MNRMFRTPFFLRLAAAAALVLAFVPPCAQAQAPAAAPVAQTLRVLPLAGNNAVNQLETQVMAPLAVQVLDANDLPVDGATVTFRFPVAGPSAVFGDQQSTRTVRTAANGQARAIGWTANNQPGPFQVQVTATRGEEMGLATILMTNATRLVPAAETPKKRWYTSKWAKIAYVGAGAAIGAKIALGGGDKTIRGTVGVPSIGGIQ